MDSYSTWRGYSCYKYEKTNTRIGIGHFPVCIPVFAQVKHLFYKINLSVLTAKNGTERHVRAELEARGLKTKELENQSLKEMKELLKEDELKRRVIETQQEGLKVSSIKYIKPISDEMRGLFSLADKVERRRLGILGDDETDSEM